MTFGSDRQPAITLVDDDFYSARLMMRMLDAHGASNINRMADPEAAEAALVGQSPSDELIAEAARLAGEAAEPKADIRGSAEYKRDVARVFVQRGLHTAINRAQGATA